MKEINNGWAFIVGGSSGIGDATAKKLLQSDIKTIIVGNRAVKLQRAVEKLSQYGTAKSIKANLYESTEIATVVNQVKACNAHIKYLVNAAGYFNPTPFLKHTEKDYEAYMGINKAIFFISQAVANNMKENRSGSIVNIGSMLGKASYQSNSIFCLLDGKVRSSRTDTASGNGIGRTQHQSQCRFSRNS